MAAPAGRDGDDAIDIRLERLLRVPDIDDVMEAQTSISMNRVSHLTRDAYRRDKDRNLVFHSQRDVLGQQRVNPGIVVAAKEAAAPQPTADERAALPDDQTAIHWTAETWTSS